MSTATPHNITNPLKLTTESTNGAIRKLQENSRIKVKGTIQFPEAHKLPDK